MTRHTQDRNSRAQVLRPGAGEKARDSSQSFLLQGSLTRYMKREGKNNHSLLAYQFLTSNSKQQIVQRLSFSFLAQEEEGKVLIFSQAKKISSYRSIRSKEEKKEPSQESRTSRNTRSGSTKAQSSLDEEWTDVLSLNHRTIKMQARSVFKRHTSQRGWAGRQESQKCSHFFIIK